MTIYCYRCGGDIEVTPTPKHIQVAMGGKVLIVWEDSVESHTCPKDAPS